MRRQIRQVNQRVFEFTEYGKPVPEASGYWLVMEIRESFSLTGIYTDY